MKYSSSSSSSMAVLAAVLLVLAASSSQAASSCTFPTLTATYAAPSVAAGYTARLVATGLAAPRSLQWDDAGHLLVLEQGHGIRSLAFRDGGADCLQLSENRSIVADTKLTHGLALSRSGEILYASTSDVVLAYDYDQGFPSVGTGARTVISGMDSGGHTTRTLLVTADDTLIISRGSNANVDAAAAELSSGRCQLRAFGGAMANASSTAALPEALDFSTHGTLLGWGLRNSVGVGQHPSSGDIWSVENSIDQMVRAGVDIHDDNPGEELNYHGHLNSLMSSSNAGGNGTTAPNYGYPDCFAVWKPRDGLATGVQMANGTGTGGVTDEWCARARTPPRLTFEAHMAPLDIKFTPDGKEAWMTFHGSWNRAGPVGYKLSRIAFGPDGQPQASADSQTSLEDVLANANNTACPSGCFRPVGLAWDTQGRLWMASDATGEVYVIVKTEAGNSSSSGGSGAGNSTGAGKSTEKTSAAVAGIRTGGASAQLWAAAAAAVYIATGGWAGVHRQLGVGWR